MFHKLIPVLLLVAGIVALAYKPSVPAGKPEGNSRMFRSDDLGHTWSPAGKGLPVDLQMSYLDTLGKRIVLASSNHSVFLSDDKKENWRQLDTMLLPSQNITSLHVANGVIFIVVADKHIYASSDLGRIWMPLNHNLYNENIMPLLRSGDELLAGTDNGIFRMKDGTNTWQKVFKGRVTSLLRLGDNYLARTPWGLFLSSDHGNTWNAFGTDCKPGDLVFIDGKIIARSGYLWDASEDMGKTWKPLNLSLSLEKGMSDIVKAGNAWVSCLSDGIYLSKDWGQEWNLVYRFPPVEPLKTNIKSIHAWDLLPEEPFIDMIVVDGVVYGGFGRKEGC